jgi:hypothetical protein
MQKPANIAQIIDRILIEARDSIHDGCLEQSEYAEGRDAAARDAHEAIDGARDRIASAFCDSDKSLGVEWTARHEWIAQFLMEDATAKLAPCEMAYRIIAAVDAIAMETRRAETTGSVAKR